MNKKLNILTFKKWKSGDSALWDCRHLRPILSRFWQHCQLQVNDPFYFYPDFGNTANYRYTTHSIQILAALPITGVRPILLRYWQHCQLQVYCTTHSTQFGNTANYRYKTHSTQISSILPITGIRPILYPSWPHWFLTRATKSSLI